MPKSSVATFCKSGLCSSMSFTVTSFSHLSSCSEQRKHQPHRNFFIPQMTDNFPSMPTYLKMLFIDQSTPNKVWERQWAVVCRKKVSVWDGAWIVLLHSYSLIPTDLCGKYYIWNLHQCQAQDNLTLCIVFKMIVRLILEYIKAKTMNY